MFVAISLIVKQIAYMCISIEPNISRLSPAAFYKSAFKYSKDIWLFVLIHRNIVKPREKTSKNTMYTKDPRNTTCKIIRNVSNKQ